MAVRNQPFRHPFSQSATLQRRILPRSQPAPAAAHPIGCACPGIFGSSDNLSRHGVGSMLGRNRPAKGAVACGALWMRRSTNRFEADRAVAGGRPCRRRSGQTQSARAEWHAFKHGERFAPQDSRGQAPTISPLAASGDGWLPVHVPPKSA
jgi:hypothetical protein